MKNIVRKSAYIRIPLFAIEAVILTGLLIAIHLVWNIGWDNIDIEKLNDRQSVGIISSAGLDISEGESPIGDISSVGGEIDIWTTTSSQNYIVIECSNSEVITLQLYLPSEKAQDGCIYYSDSADIASFGDRDAELMSFYSGTIEIETDNPDVKYALIQPSFEAGVEFDIISFDRQSVLSYAVENTDFRYFLLAGLLLALMWELVRAAMLTDSAAQSRPKDRLERISSQGLKTDVLFWFVMAISVILVYGLMMSGKVAFLYTDVGSDGYNQYYPYMVNTVLSIQNGTFSVWDWNYGLGTSVLRGLIWILDPFAIPVIAAGVAFGAGIVQYLLIWMQVAKLLVCFALAKVYMSYFLTDRRAVCLGAYLCAMNGYLFLWGQHFFLGTACVFALLVFIFIERYILSRGKKGCIGMTITVAVLLIYSFYTGYMILLAGSIYFLFREFTAGSHQKAEQHILSIIGYGISVIVGMLMSGIIFLPQAYYTLTNSTRLDSSGETATMGEKLADAFLSSFGIDEIGTRLSRLLSNNLLYVNMGYDAPMGNYYETPQLFLTAFIFVFLGIWLMQEIRDIVVYAGAEKHSAGTVIGRTATLAVKLILLYLLIFNSLTGLVMNAFVEPSYRYTYLAFPILALGVGLVTERMLAKGRADMTEWIGTAIGLILTACGMWYSYANNRAETNVTNYILLMSAVLVIGMVIMLIALLTKKLRLRALTLFIFVAMLTTLMDATFTTNMRGWVAQSELPVSWNENMEFATEESHIVARLKEQDTSVWRVGKNYADYTMMSDSFFEQYSTAAVYDSSANSHTEEFFEKIYINEYNDSTLKRFAYDTELQKVAASLINTRYIFSEIELYDANLTLIDSFEGKYLYLNNDTDSLGKWYTSAISREDYEKLEDDDKKAGTLRTSVVLEDEEALAKLEPAAGVVTTDSDNLDYLDYLETIAEEAPATTVSAFALEGQTTVVGSVDAQETGLLMVAIPDQEGWTVTVDGEECDYINADYGFIGLLLEAGHHDIVLHYEMPMMDYGRILSMIGAALFAIMLILRIVRAVACKKL